MQRIFPGEIIVKNKKVFSLLFFALITAQSSAFAWDMPARSSA